MKKSLFTFAFVALTSLAFVSCQVEVIESEKQQEEMKGNELHFIVKAFQDSQTKTSVIANGDGTYTSNWKNGDQLGAFLDGTTILGTTDAVDMTLSNTAADGSTGVFEGTAVGSGTGTFLAFYPKSAFEKGYDDGTVGLNIGATSDYIQHPTVGSPDPSCDILLSKACGYESTGSNVEINDLYFMRPLSILKINLKGTYAAGEEVSWLKFSVSDGTISGRVKVNLTTPAVDSWTASKKYAWAEYSTSKPVINHATDNTVYLVVNPTTLAMGTTVTVTGETAHVNIEKTFNLVAPMTFPEGNIAVLNLTINAGDCSVKASENYILVTTAGAFEAGAKYVFAFKDGDDGHYEFINNSGSSKTIDDAALTVTDGVISSPNSKYTFTAETGGTSGTFNFKSSSGNYIYNSGSSSTLNTNSGTKTDWLPTFIDESKTYKIQNTSTSGRYFAHNGGTDAKAYAISNFHDQVTENSALAANDGAISVFKYSDGRSKLSTPADLAVSTKIVSWTAVANAGSYTVTIDGNNYVTTSTSYTYTGADGYFDVSVVAHPTLAGVDTYKDSDAAELAKVTFGTPTLATPELTSGGITATSVTVTWTDDVNATAGYHCEIYNGLSKVDEDDVDAGDESVTFTGLTKGTEYTVKVNAKAVTGTYPWAASEVASINMTPDGQSVSSVTSNGSYNIPDLTVMAVNGRNIIAADATGAILIYAAAGHGMVVNDVITVNGSVISYHGVWEFSGPTITKTGTTTAIYPSPVAYDDAMFTSYSSSPVIEYATTSGIASSAGRSVTSAGGKVYNVYGDLSSVDGKSVIITGYVFGYNSSKVDFMLVDEPTIDPSVPSLTTTPASGSTIEWDDDEFGDGNAQTISVTLNGAAAANGYTVSSGNAAWTVVDNGTGTITVYPNAANESTTVDKTLDVTITHKDNGGLTSTITLKQNKQTGGGGGGGTLTIDFESAANSYSDWTITTIVTQQTNANVSAHGGSYYGDTDGKTTGSIVTKNKISSPGTLTFYISKESTNTTASSWLIKVSSDGSTWTQVGDAQSASSGITRGTWTEVTRDLSSYSNVYVKIEYSGTTAVRCIDDVSLTYN